MFDPRSEPDAGLQSRLSRRTIAAYKAMALFGFNTLLVFIGANLLAAAALALDRHLETGAGDPVTARYGKEAVISMYPGIDSVEVRSMLSEVWSLRLVFEPFTQTREPPVHGRYVTVDSAGFRHSSDQGIWPPDSGAFKVFLMFSEV